MYMLRLISAVLHQDVGPAVSDAALDLRRGELAVLVPLVAILLVLSAWPNAVSGHSFGRAAPCRARPAARHRLPIPAAGCTVIHKPHVDWFALSPTLALLGAAGLLLLVAVFLPRAGPAGGLGDRLRRGLRDRVRVRRRARRSAARTARRSSPTRSSVTAGRRSPRYIVAGCGLVAVLVSYGERMRGEHIGEYYALLAAAGAGMVFFVGGQPDDALPRPRVVLDRALRPVRDRHRPRRLARGRAQVPDHRRGRLRDAALRIGDGLRRDRRARLRRDRRRRRTRATRCSCSGWR